MTNVIKKCKSKRYSAVKIILFCALIIAAGSCKKEGDQGPQGAQGPAGTANSYRQGGSIQGNINGIRSDGSPFSISFNNQYYHILDNYSYDESNFEYDFSLERHPGSDPLTQGYCSFSFSLSSLSSSVSLYSRFYGYFFKDLGNNQTLEWYVNANSSSFSTIIVSNLSYNSATHIAQGNFTINVDGADNSTGNPATISGSFQSIAMTQYVTAVNPEINTYHSAR